MDKKPYRLINLFRVKGSYIDKDFSELLNEDHEVVSYDLAEDNELEGQLFVKVSSLSPPKWSNFAEEITGSFISELSNKSSSAVLFLKVETGTFAMTFGYGRFLLDIYAFEYDFGIRTALNTLNHESLRSVDIHSLEDQPIQKKAQATRESDASIFGIDISKDILRAVTGTPKSGINFKNISGGDGMYSFGKELVIDDLPVILNQISSYYTNEDYKDQFSWVDNVRRIKVKADIDILDNRLIVELEARNTDVKITIPEVEKWDSILGFSFTRSKDRITPIIESELFYSNLPYGSISIEQLKRDRIFIHDIHDNIRNHPIYKCLYWEFSVNGKTNILFGGTWYLVDNNFMASINETLANIENSTIQFPAIETWTEEDKQKIETEGDYNERIASSEGFFLMDKKLIKTNKTTSAIELCDLFTIDKSFIHAKHRKGGSAGLSHLFAQGAVSAELILGDKEFRKKARTKLNTISSAARDLIPLDNPKGQDFEIVYLILGDDPENVKNNLPFFSKVNLSRVYENLSQRGFNVTIGAATKVQRT